MPTTRIHQDATDIRTRFKSAFTDVQTAIRVIVENQPEDRGGTPFPAIDSEFVYVRIRQNDSQQVSLGGPNRAFRNFGTINIYIQTEIGKGTKRDEEIADLVGRALGSMTLGGLILRNPRHNAIGPADGRWYRSAVITRYESSFIE